MTLLRLLRLRDQPHGARLAHRQIGVRGDVGTTALLWFRTPPR